MNLTGRAVNRVVGRFQRRFGIRRSRQMARRYNQWRYAEELAYAERAFEQRTELLSENDPSFSGTPRNLLKDGWCVDRSGTLPGIDRALAETDRLIAERGGVDRRGTRMAQRDYLFYLLLAPDELDVYPGILDFLMSSEVIATAAEAMGTMPVMAQNLPHGVRMFESTDRFNSQSTYEASQLFHRDIHSRPLIYVILLARDTSEANGPWHFLPQSVSDQASDALGYEKRGVPYYVTDERMAAVTDLSQVIQFTGRRGDVLFLDSSRCFHYGSRDAVEPGYRVMYALTPRWRCDFRLMLERLDYPVEEGDSRLRQIVKGHCPALEG